MPNPVGRPTKYTPELVHEARLYITGYEEHGHMIPSIAGLSIVLNITRKTIYEWEKEDDKTEFCDILTKIMANQELVLTNKGLSGDFNSNITKLVLGKHGYHDKSDENVRLSGDPDNKCVIEFVHANNSTTGKT